MINTQFLCFREDFSGCGASEFAESEISLFVWNPQDYSRKGVLEVKREVALEIEIGCMLGIRKGAGFDLRVQLVKERFLPSRASRTKKLGMSPEAQVKGKVG